MEEKKPWTATGKREKGRGERKKNQHHVIVIEKNLTQKIVCLDDYYTTFILLRWTIKRLVNRRAGKKRVKKIEHTDTGGINALSAVQLLKLSMMLYCIDIRCRYIHIQLLVLFIKECFLYDAGVKYDKLLVVIVADVAIDGQRCRKKSAK